MKAIGILWNSMNDYTNQALCEISKYCKINDTISINFESLFSDFISRIYPYTGEELWKQKYKIDHMNNIYESNEIKIIFVDTYSNEKVFVDRKGIYINKNVEELKSYIRNKYKNQVKNYAFDNVYHMTDNEEEYKKTVTLIVNYIINFFSYNKKVFDLDKILYTTTQNFENSVGKRNKIFLFDNNIIHKEKKNNSFENFAEVFCYQFLKKLDINVAEYYFSKYKNNDGVITKNFIGSDEIFIDGTDLIDAYLTYVEVGKIKCNLHVNHNIEAITKYNNIDDLEIIIEKLSSIYNIDLSSVVKNLKQTYAIDLLFLQSDRNPYNWGILINKSNGKIRFAPLYDNSNIFNFNKPIILNEMIKNIDNDQYIYSLSIKNNPTLLRVHKYEDLFTSKTLLIASIDNYDIIKYMEEMINKIDFYGLENIIDEIINNFPKKLQNTEFKKLVFRLLTINMSYIKENLLHNKIKMLK